MIVRDKIKHKNINSYAFVGIVIMAILAIMSTSLTFASEDPATWQKSEYTALEQAGIDYLLANYRDESYKYYVIYTESGGGRYTLAQSDMKPYAKSTNILNIHSGQIEVGDTTEYRWTKQAIISYEGWLISTASSGIMTASPVTSTGMSYTYTEFPVLQSNFDWYTFEGVFLLEGNIANDITNGIGNSENPIITYTNNETSDVTFNLWSNGQSNITILEPAKWVNTATIGTSHIPFTMTPGETIKVKWNSGDDINYSVVKSETSEYVSDSIIAGETFTYTNNTGIEQDIRIFADNGVRAVIRLIQNIKTITPPTVETIPVLPNQTITFVVLEGSVTAKISDYTPIEEPQIYDPSKVLNILSPNNNTITALNDITIRFTVERPRIENPQIQFKLNNQQSWYPLEFSEQGFRVEDNSTITTIKRTYEVPIRLLGDQINNLRIRVINAGMVTQEETVSIIHKSFEDDGTGLDVVTGEEIDPTQMPPLDGNENDMMGIPDEDDYEDSIFGQVKYLADTITNAITMPFRFIGEALVHISDWFIESAGWIGTMNDIMRGFIGFVPEEIQDAILVLIYATVIFSVFALMRK